MYSQEDFILEQLQEAGWITPQDIQTAAGQKLSGEGRVDALIRNGTISDKVVAQTLAQACAMDYLDLGGYHVPPDAKQAVTREIARRYKVAPIAMDGYVLRLAISDPMNIEVMDSLPHVLNNEIEFVCATPTDIQSMIVNAYGEAEDIADFAEKLTGQKIESSRQDAGGDSGTDEAPIIKLVTQTLFDAFKNRASDIHIEPIEKVLRIRYRIDGVLHDVAHHPKKLHAAITARIKIMTGTMSIDEKRIPQDGRISVNLQGREIDLRVSSVPTSHGESIVMRILDKSSLRLGLADLGFLSDDQENFEQLITLPDGIILVTGPTGSGKTTTLYACLHFINKPDKKIITVEDPVEYELPGINQVHVKEDIGMSFGAALRSILRQAPNIIMIGEIRDMETAGIAINASLTGHLVFSTLHTNDAPSAVARLSDIGIKPFLTASAVRAIEAQRLVRRLCRECKIPGSITEKEMRQLRLDPRQLAESTLMGPGGCNNCRGTGFRGRMSLIEIFKIDDEVRKMINEKLSTPQLRRRARELGMRTLREDGVRKVLAGMTTADEVIESTMSDAD
jgi:type IV pilus assembly protein PilB